MKLQAENQSVLNLVDLYFSNIHFSQKKEKLGNITLNITYEIKHFKDDNNPLMNKIEITTNILEPLDRIKISLTANGIFELKDINNSLDEKTKENLVKKNTVAIMLPFIRSQISMLTSQPGLSPIMLPITNVNDLIDEKKK